MKPIVARSLAATKNGLTTTGVLGLQGGKLEPSGFRLLDNDVSDGTLSFELRSGGIGRGFEAKQLSEFGFGATLQEFPGRIVATLRATKPFTSGTAKLAPNGRSVTITLVEPAPVTQADNNNDDNDGNNNNSGSNPPPRHEQPAAAVVQHRRRLTRRGAAARTPRVRRRPGRGAPGPRPASSGTCRGTARRVARCRRSTRPTGSGRVSNAVLPSRRRLAFTASAWSMNHFAWSSGRSG